MTFLHPWLLALGAAAIALPLVIHRLTRPRPRRLPLSTVRFVREAVKEKRAKYRLRDWLVLLLRTAAVVLLAWAFARPLTGAKPLVKTDGQTSGVRVVLLDASFSMSAVSSGQSAFDRGKAVAAKFVQYQPGLRADLIVAAARPTAVFDGPSANFAALSDAIAAASPLPQRLDVQAAINRATEILAKGVPHQRMELVIVSDFQRSSWATADFSPLPKGVNIQFDSVVPAGQVGNIAILDARATGRIEQGREIRLEVDIGNYSSSLRNVTVNVTAGDSTCRLTGLCPPGVKTTLAGTILPRSAGWIGGRATLVDNHDALAGDDSRSFVLGILPPPTYALITRESSRPHPSSSHYLERALVPMPPQPGKPGEHVARIDPGQPDRAALAAASLLVLDHPGKLSPEMIDLLTAMVRRGRGLLYVAAEPIDASNLKGIADAAGTDFKMPVEFRPPLANQPRENLFLLEWKKDQPPFGRLTELMNAVGGSLRFSGGLSSARLDTGLSDDVLATYSDRSAALVVTSCGAGTIAVLNADLTESNLPASPLMVPVVQELAGRLLSTHATASASACGEPFAAYLPPDTTTPDRLSVVDPAGIRQSDATLTQDGTLVLWHQDAAGPPGVYQVKRGDDTVYALATAAPASESDLQTLDPQTLKTRLAAGRSVYFENSADQPPRADQWTWILVACAGCLIGEVGVLKLFRT
jgi:hypothetical protein